MTHPKLKKYIQAKLKYGVSQTDIIEELKKAGWKIQDINIALGEIQGMLNTPLLIGVFTLTREAWKIYRSRFLLFSSIVFIPLVIDSISSLILQMLYPGYSLEDAIIILLYNNFWATIFFVGVYFAASILLYTWALLALIYAALREDISITLKQSFLETKKLFPSFFWLMLLSSFIIIGGVFLFIIPGIIFSIWFLFASYILVDKNIKGIRALMASKKYVQGFTFQILRKLVFLIFIVLLISFLFGLISHEIELLLTKIFHLPQKFTVFLEEIFTFLSIFFLYPFVVIYNIILYRSLKNIKSDISYPSPTFPHVLFINSAVGWVLAILFSAYLASQFIFFFKDKPSTENIDLFVIQTPLSMYKRENKKYPQHLDMLVSKYVEKLPPSFQNLLNYTYTTENNNDNYRLCVIKDVKKDECVSK